MNYEPWVIGGAALAAIFALGILSTISNHLQEISRQLRNFHDDVRADIDGLGQRVEDTGTRLEMEIDKLRPASDWDEPPPR